MTNTIKVQVGKIGRGLIELELPGGSTIDEAINISGYHFTDETRIKLTRDPEAHAGTVLQDGDKFYLVDNLQGGLS